MGRRAVLFGKLLFPPHQIAVWRGLLSRPIESQFSDFFQPTQRTLMISELLAECNTLNESLGPSFFLFIESKDTITIRAWLEEEVLATLSTSLLAAFQQAGQLGACGDVFFVDIDQRCGVCVHISDDTEVYPILFHGEVEKTYAGDLQEVFELGRRKLFGPSTKLVVVPDVRPTSSHLPLSPLSFLEELLFVSYRASLESQWLDIQIQTSRVEQELVPLFSLFVSAVHQGLGGGLYFSPLTGSAALKRCECEKKEELWEYRFSLELSAVSPPFLGLLIAFIVRMLDQGIQHISVLGSLPLDGTVLSIGENTICQWLSSCFIPLDEWPYSEFSIVRRPEGSISSVRIEFASEPTAQNILKLKQWIHQVLSMMHCELSPKGSNKKTTSPFGSFNIQRNRCHVRLNSPSCPFRVPIHSIFINMLTRFHHQALPVSSLVFA
ncbi:hypothetical protein [Pajaroellobacter abortibovis]|nr:hypothetical protein [Pajaroellobacter abortibovis]